MCGCAKKFNFKELHWRFLWSIDLLAFRSQGRGRRLLCTCIYQVIILTKGRISRPLNIKPDQIAHALLKLDPCLCCKVSSGLQRLLSQLKGKARIHLTREWLWWREARQPTRIATHWASPSSLQCKRQHKKRWVSEWYNPQPLWSPFSLSQATAKGHCANSSSDAR